MENKETFKIYSGNRSLHELILAAVFYTATLYSLLTFLYFLTIDFSIGQSIIELNRFFVIGLPSLAFGLRFSVSKDLFLNSKTNEIISLYRVGPFSKSIKAKTKEFDYVAVYLNPKDEYETNLWCQGNKHYPMFVFEECEDAMKFAKVVSEKLSVDLLDASQKGQKKWIEVSQLQNDQEPNNPAI